MSLPYLPFYPKDFFSDERTAEMSTEQQGLWIILLCRMWLNDAAIRDDDKRIARMLKVSDKKWLELKAVALETGLLLPCDGILTNRRLNAEHFEAENKCQKARAAGIKSGEARKLRSAEDERRALLQEQAALLRDG